MTEPKNFQKGKHTYTRYGANFKEVHVPGKPKPAGESPAAEPLTFDVDPGLECGVYANFSALHRSSDEAVLDFCFLAPGRTRGKVRSRVVLAHKHVRQLAELLKRTVDEMDQAGK